MAPRQISKRRAFSLLEIMLSLFAIGIAISAFVPASLNSRKMVVHDRRKELATTVAGAVLDQERALGYTNLALGSSALPAGFSQPDLPHFSGSIMTGLLDSSLNSTATDSGRKKVDVTVSWDDKRKDKGSITVSTIIAND